MLGYLHPQERTWDQRLEKGPGTKGWSTSSSQKGPGTRDWRRDLEPEAPGKDLGPEAGVPSSPGKGPGTRGWKRDLGPETGVPLPLVDRQQDRHCKNITFPRTKSNTVTKIEQHPSRLYSLIKSPWCTARTIHRLKIFVHLETRASSKLLCGVRWINDDRDMKRIHCDVPSQENLPAVLSGVALWRGIWGSWSASVQA